MNYLRYAKAAFLLAILVTCISCKSKQDKTAANSGTPQQSAGSPGAPAPGKSTAPLASPQDKADSQTVAARVLILMESGDFHSIYKDSSAGFKQVGSEDQFVGKFQQTRNSVGVLKNPREISFGVLPGNGYVLVYRAENERYKSDLRLTFTRSPSGKMELAGLNQHDELKK